jgi:hypothetical protein
MTNDPIDWQKETNTWEQRNFELAQLKLLATLRKFGPQTADGLATAFGTARGTVHFNVSRLGDRVLTVPAPGRGNCKVYVAAN